MVVIIAFRTGSVLVMAEELEQLPTQSFSVVR